MAENTSAERLAGRRVLVVANEQVAERMAGPAIRSLNLARQLADRGASVTLAMPAAPSGLLDQLDGIDDATFDTPSARRFRELADAHDVVVTQPQRVDVMRGLSRARARIVYDLYVPSFVERIAQLGTEPGDERLKRRLLERDRLEYATALQLGDAFVCASERQRDHWLGALGQAGRLDLHLLERDPRADALVGVVPFGVADQAPEPLTVDAAGAIRGTLVPEDSIVLLWTGGLWNWFDPVVVVEGLAKARETEPRLRLVVMGMHHPEAHWEEQDASRRMREHAAELGLLDGDDPGVVLCDTWIPYLERHRYLLDADAGVSAHHDTLETRFSFRTRFLDHLWTGLPTLTTPGGELADAMVQCGAALPVDEGDAEAWRIALLKLAGDPDLRAQMSVAARELAPTYYWSRVSDPLVDLVAATQPGAPRQPLGRLALLRYAWLLVRIRAQAKGIGSLGSAVRGASGRARS
ncbi:MAG: gtuS2-22 [Thermoleophilia bacterium]|nr:gtuS2-22 [Thermoleophilia bacterium]